MRILVIPDTQCAPGSPLRHLLWAGQLIVDERPDVVVHLGDHWDFPSLSRYDDVRAMEGRRYTDDVEAGNAGMRSILHPLREYNATRRQYKERQWWPTCYFVTGNHEDRLRRWLGENPQMDRASFDDLDLSGWEVIDFLEVLQLESVAFSHYFYNQNSGKPLGGSVLNRLRQIGHSFVQGHQQGLQRDQLYTALGHRRIGIVAGSFYKNKQGYKGPQGDYWRGVLILDDVHAGDFEVREYSLAKLERMYGSGDESTGRGRSLPESQSSAA